MKISFSITTIFIIFFSFITSIAQSKIISSEEYEKAFQFAVRETNADYPFVFTVITSFIENGKTVRTVTEIREAESRGHERIKKIDISNGRKTSNYQIKVGFGNVFCSDDGISWISTKYECSGPVMIYGRRDRESIEYSVNTKVVNQKDINIYREYSVFASSDGKKEKNFRETVATIDSRGFFIDIEDKEGTIQPKKVTLIRKQSWNKKATITPIVSPIK
jgi:hypothetical protein